MADIGDAENLQASGVTVIPSRCVPAIKKLQETT
jgi:hypothetical protein